MTCAALPKTYVFTVPGVPPSLNVWVRMNAFKRARAQEIWQYAVQGLLNQKGNVCPRGLERVELHAILTFTTARRRDSDNYSSPLWKWTQDVLVFQRVIPDDTHDRCKGLPPKIGIGSREETLIMLVPQSLEEDS